MGKIKLIVAIMLLASLGMSLANAQSGNEYALDMSSGRLVVDQINKVEFIGTTKKSVSIRLKGQSPQTSDRAKGLKLINGSGLEDNTGIGLSVERENDATVVRQVSRNSDSNYVIEVPKGVTIVYDHSTPHGDNVFFRNITGEIEVTTLYSSIRLENVTGPMTIGTVHGNIDVIFSMINQSNPISIVSTHGEIDLAIPASSKANLNVNAGRGEVYSDLEIKMVKDSGSMKQYRGTNNVVGLLNGGGVSFQVQSDHGSIYLRKK